MDALDSNRVDNSGDHCRITEEDSNFDDDISRFSDSESQSSNTMFGSSTLAWDASSSFEHYLKTKFRSIGDDILEIVLCSVSAVVHDDYLQYALYYDPTKGLSLLLPDSIDKEIQNDLYQQYRLYMKQRKKEKKLLRTAVLDDTNCKKFWGESTKNKSLLIKVIMNGKQFVDDRSCSSRIRSTTYCDDCWLATHVKINNRVIKHVCLGQPVAVGVFPGPNSCGVCHTPCINFRLEEHVIRTEPFRKAMNIPKACSCHKTKLEPSDTYDPENVEKYYPGFMNATVGLMGGNDAINKQCTIEIGKPLNGPDCFPTQNQYDCEQQHPPNIGSVLTAIPRPIFVKASGYKQMLIRKMTKKRKNETAKMSTKNKKRKSFRYQSRSNHAKRRQRTPDGKFVKREKPEDTTDDG